VGCSTTTLIRVVPLVVDLRLYEGDDVFLRVVVTDPDTFGPADLTGYTAQSQIRAAAGDAEIMAEFTTEIIDNFVYLTLTSPQTTGLVGRGVWDVQLVDADGVVGTVAGGRVTWVAEVTR